MDARGTARGRGHLSSRTKIIRPGNYTRAHAGLWPGRLPDDETIQIARAECDVAVCRTRPCGTGREKKG